jgi:tetratricopeptide (TPR) repeat protein
MVLNHIVVLKLLKEKYVYSEEFKKRFRREAESIASLSHRISSRPTIGGRWKTVGLISLWSILREGRYEEAEPLYERALEIFEKVLGPEHPYTTIGLNNLALLYHEQGGYEEAE